MKAAKGKFFLLGVIIGGTILFSAIQLERLIALTGSRQAISTATSTGNFPRLIATEPLQVFQQVEPSIAPITDTSPLEVISTATQPRPTATPLVMSRDKQPEVIGSSVDGLPLEVYTFGTGEHGRMIVAGIHGGDEWNTITLANQLIAYVDQNPQVVPQDVTLHILRNLNPDGERRSHDKYGRLNSHGVDLNRNFPANWQKDWERKGCWNYLPTSSGSEAGSEPEIKALMIFLGSHRIDALISYHSAALGIFPGGIPWDERSVKLAQAIADVSPYLFPPLDTGCIYTGTLADYAVSTGIPAVEIELTNHFETDFEINLNILNTLLTFQP